MNHFAEPIEFAGQKGLLCLEGQRLQRIHCRDRFELPGSISGYLIVDDKRRATGPPDVRQHHALLKLTNDGSRHPQWIDESPVSAELHKVKAAKRGCVLILPAAADP